MSQLTPQRRGFLNMPKLPLSGFLIRLVAFLLDMVTILAAIHIFGRSFPDIFWALGANSGYVTAGFTFLYFVLFNGPFGKGQTVGKMIVGIIVTDYDGQPPSWRQAVLRTVILMPPFVMVPVTEVLIGPAMSSMDFYIMTLATHFLLLAMLVTTALVIPFNPFKQGLHDYVAQTLIQPRARGAFEPVLFEDLAGTLGREWPKFHRQPQISGLVTLLMIMSLFAYLAWPGQQRPDYREYLEARHAMAGLPGFTGSTVEPPISERALKVLEEGDDDMIREASWLAEDMNTSGPLVLVLEVSRPGKWPNSVLENEALSEAYLDQYHQTVFPAFIREYDTEIEGQQGTMMERRRLIAALWSERDIRLRLVYINRLSFTPHILTLREEAGKFEKTYPALIQ
ncbi:MAG: RDD family protein [Candidatus Sumerlaeia bacterium]|nr:RDD family protein [Candidatus Sumerlaeia bacterium]